ncbi:MAG: zinc-binding dehydrogenase [Ekhidna sp.]|nr:zinc-binding dehydrogenase [Ekhidna sp.]
MKAYFLKKNGPSNKAFELREIDSLVPNDNQVLIKSEGFGLNFADVMARLGMYQDCPKLPAVIGYENVGIIEAVGNAVKGVEIGDRVVAFTRFGGYSDHVLVDASEVVQIPAEWSIGTACALATQYTTAHYSVYKATHVGEGERVLVHAAAGGLGIALVQLLKRKGCTVIGTASSSKIDFLKSIGVDHAIDYRTQDYFKEIQKIGLAGKVDVSFNAIGGNSSKKDYRLLNSGGRLVLLGAAELTSAKGNIFKLLKVLLGFGLISPIKFMVDSKSTVGVNMLRITDNRRDISLQCFQEVVDLARKGDLAPVVAKEFHHSELAEAHDFLASRKSIGKIAVKW